MSQTGNDLFGRRAVVYWEVDTGRPIRRMPTCQFLKVVYVHLQKVGARAYVHLDFCDRKAVYPPIFFF
jgi:hypothetical protein